MQSYELRRRRWYDDAKEMFENFKYEFEALYEDILYLLGDAVY